MSQFGGVPVQGGSMFGGEAVAAQTADPAKLQAQFWQQHAAGDQDGMKATFQQMQAQGVHLASPQVGSIATNGVSTGNGLSGSADVQNFAAGAGKSLYDTARGLGQLTGLQSQGDINAAQKQDAPLMATGAGGLGNAVGTAGQFLLPVGDAAAGLGVVGKSAPFVNAAIKGLAFGGAQPVEEGQSRLGNAATSAAFNVGGLGVSQGLGKLAQAASPVLDPVKAQGIALLRAAGIQPSLAQVSNSPSLDYLSSMAGKMPFGGGAAAKAERVAGFTRAASNLVGEDTPKIGQDVMDGVKAKLGNAYDTIFGRNQVTLDMPTAQRLGVIADKASTDLTPENAQIVHNQIAKYTDAATKNGGQIPGKLYQDIRGELQRLQSPDAKGAMIGDVRKAMQDAANNSFTGNDAAALKLTNQQYANMKVLEKSLAGGPNGALDEVSPGSLWSKVNGQYGATPEMRALAQAGKNVLTEPPSSGTAERSIISHLFGMGGAGGIGFAAGGLPGLAAGVALPSAAGATIGRFLNSPAAAKLLPGLPSNTLNGLSRLTRNSGPLAAAYARQK